MVAKNRMVGLTEPVIENQGGILDDFFDTAQLGRLSGFSRRAHFCRPIASTYAALARKNHQIRAGSSGSFQPHLLE